MKYIKLFIFYTQTIQLNYNKSLIPTKLLQNYKIFKNNNIIIDEYIINDPDEFNDELYKEIVNNNDKFFDSIFWLHQKIGSYIIIFDKIYQLIKKLNIKTIFWMDDLHFPKHNINNDTRYINSDIIISPSTIYFQNINNEFYNKSKFLFYFFDENLIDKYNPNIFSKAESHHLEPVAKRINKIILSGKINQQYISRKQMYANYKNNNQLYDIIEHPGYYNMKHEIYHIKYYDTLSKYKGALLGLANFPINFLLAKVIEILGCGCLGFFEYSDLYEEQLGLRPWVHYIPIYKVGRSLIFNNDEYKRLIESKKGINIAINGYKYIKKNYNSITFTNKVIKIIHTLYNTND